MQYLNLNTRAYSNVMATFNTGMLASAFTHNKLFIAHEGTREFSKKWAPHMHFMWGEYNASEAKQFLEKYKMSYVIWDTGASFEAYKEFLTLVYKNEDILIFKTAL